jgi:hypothetical protein
MNKDELILEIIEKVHEQSSETARKVGEIQVEQARQGVVLVQNTEHLDEHMTRTANLEKRVAFYDSVIIVLTGIAAVVVFAIKVLPYVIRLLQ